MTYHSSISRRGFLRSTAMSAAAMPVSGQVADARETGSVSHKDFIEDYLGVTALSYGDPSGELTYREVVEDPPEFEDCVYRIAQTIIAQDGSMGSQKGSENPEDPTIVDGRFELHLSGSDMDGLPAFYREFESAVEDSEYDSEETGDETAYTSQFSIKSYPGLFTHYIEPSPLSAPEKVGVVWYAQTVPWGLLYWDVVYDSAAEVELHVDAHQQYLREHSDQEWDVPSLGIKSHWQEVHDEPSSGKGRYRGDISPILEMAPGLEHQSLEHTDERLWEASSADQSAVVALNSYR